MKVKRVKVNSSEMDALLKSSAVAGSLEEVAGPVESAARADPNPAYSQSIRMTTHVGPSRVSVRVGAAPFIGGAVEAKRGTLARALGQAGG